MPPFLPPKVLPRIPDCGRYDPIFNRPARHPLIHFVCFYFQIQCIGKIYDLYEKDDTVYVSENYPQVILNNENDAHFSFMSDRDTASEYELCLYAYL